MEQEPNFELEPTESLSSQEVVDALDGVLEAEDIEFLNQQIADEETQMAVDDVVGYVYDRLLELGEDPDEVLMSLGLLENQA